ncbi:ABC transporter ATP-binding protein [Actinomycetospora sp. TBRC 11914]|uniref:ABC transporter ATP-binding protein n=1 Tax=Actinomycetospora sp. TBRC 11914 TaxID=2729387 RepID=UPI00145D4935|nr:ABC transporter ATP-binding protein [Actinomycetospora sp. TBRC 11914]NMO91476.1 ABC transporter ATP-binding protein [Actinomycetospora sp. TBRC 11914]
MTIQENVPTTEIPRADGGGAAIELEGVTKSFGGGPPVLDDLDLRLREGAITTVLGPSGTGKSVLLKHVLGLLEPDRGRVRVFGEDLWAMTLAQRRALRTRFGVLFQDGALFGSMDLFDNVAFPLRRHTELDEDEVEEKVMTRLREVGLEDSKDKAPNEISGGMRKRAGFARALVMDPEILLFDEPDSGLDPVRTNLLTDLVLRIHEEHGGTYVLVTHDIATARKVSDDVGVLYRGRLVHSGPADEAFESDDEFVRQFLSGDSDGPLGMD